MADLIRTVPEDGEEPEASDEEMAPVMSFGGSKKSRGNGSFFRDLVSDDEDGPAGGWDFAAIPAQDYEEREQGATTNLATKIEERLQQRRSADGEPVDAAPQPIAAQRKAVAVSRAGTADHLRTDMHFADLRLSKPLLRAVTGLGFDTPTPIQRDVIPPALQGLDILATAETGSGKTASFLLPALERLCQSASVRSRKRDASGRVQTGRVATKAMILLPTRELAMQCHQMLKDLAKFTLVTYQLVAGGFDQQQQSNSLRQQPDLVVATPGRILDHLLNSQSVHMELLEIVIFDEADRLLELGFRDECTQVLKRCSNGKQTMLFSATMNTSVEDLAELALVKPVRVHASPVNRVAETLEQEFVKAPAEELREAVLLSLCSRNYTKNVIVFCATKQAAHRLAIIFGLCGMRFAEIHGNLAQGDRFRALQQFQQGEADFLLATDLAARGLDLPNVEIVINFHLPFDISRYIHRVGRTARMGRTGRAVTVYVPAEYAKVKKLGRQCATKVKSKVLKRTIAADAVQTWVDKVAGLEDDIKEIREEEGVERELRLADLLANKSENLEKFKKQIEARPAKQWIMSNMDKRKLREKDSERVQQNAEALAEDAEKELEPRPAKKSRRGAEKDNLTPEERKVKKQRDRLKKKIAEEKAEKAASEWKVRASARRQKNAAKGGPEKKVAPAQTAVKNKNKKKKRGKN